MRWYSPRDWIEGEEEGEEGGDCPLPDLDTNSSPPQQTSQQKTEEIRDEGSLQGTSSVTGGDTEMETGEAATESGDAGEGGESGEGGDGGNAGEGGDGWDNEGWGEEDWDMINDDGEEKSKQKDSPSQDISVTEPPAVKVKICLTVLVQNLLAKAPLMTVFL